MAKSRDVAALTGTMRRASGSLYDIAVGDLADKPELREYVETIAGDLDETAAQHARKWKKPERKAARRIAKTLSVEAEKMPDGPLRALALRSAIRWGAVGAQKGGES